MKSKNTTREFWLEPDPTCLARRSKNTKTEVLRPSKSSRSACLYAYGLQPLSCRLSGTILALRFHPAPRCSYANLDKTRLLITYRISASALAIWHQFRVKEYDRAFPRARVYSSSPIGTVEWVPRWNDPRAVMKHAFRRPAHPYVVPQSSVETPESFVVRVMFPAGARITIQKLGESSECKQRTQNDGLTSR